MWPLHCITRIHTFAILMQRKQEKQTNNNWNTQKINDAKKVIHKEMYLK